MRSTALRVLALACAACGVLAASAIPATADQFDHAYFAQPTVIDNPWLPMRPGMQLTYTGTTVEGTKRVRHRLVSTVTDLTKTIAGVRTVVVWDRDFSAGQVVEAEIAFFAQDVEGNVWELGEHPEAYEDGRIVESPTWIHGVGRARAGISMKAAPRAGRPSYSLGFSPVVDFTDRARVLQTAARTCIPSRCFARTLLVDEFNPDQPGKHQLKYYAAGVGNVRVAWSGAREDSKETLVLTNAERLGPAAMARARRAALKLERSAYRINKSLYGSTAPIERSHVSLGNLGWAGLKAATGRGGASLTTVSARIVVSARVTALPTLRSGIKIEVIRPGGRIVRTTWLRDPALGATVRVALARRLYARHPGRWHARFVVQGSVRSAIAFVVRPAKRHSPPRA